jgi:hypothetical protein
MITDHDFATRWARRGDRWSIVRQVFADWRTPLAPADGLPSERIDAGERGLGAAFPAALREWYAMAGNRDDLAGRGNHLIPPEGLAVREEDDMVVFYHENQCVYWWALRRADLSLEDPPVFVSEAGDDDWVREDPTVSQFFLQMTLLETQFTAPFTANAEISPELIEVIGREYEDLGLAWWHWPAYPGRRFAGKDLLISTDGPTRSGKGWIWLAAKTRQARENAMRVLDKAASPGTLRSGRGSPAEPRIDWLVEDE